MNCTVCVADAGTSSRNKLAGPAVAAAKLDAHVLRGGEVSAVILTYAPAYRADHLVDLIREDLFLEQVQNDSGSTGKIRTVETALLICGTCSATEVTVVDYKQIAKR